jgi:hypothetical protein
MHLVTSIDVALELGHVVKALPAPHTMAYQVMAQHTLKRGLVQLYHTMK